MRRRFTRFVLLIMALVALMPGVFGAFEHAAELLAHGHLAHSDVREADVLGDEHGCTPVQHHCPCHESPSVAGFADAVAAAAALEAVSSRLEPSIARRASSAAYPRARAAVPPFGAIPPPTPPPNA